MWDWLGSEASKNIVSGFGSGLSAYGTYRGQQEQKKQFNKMFDLEKSQLKRENDKEDERQKIIDSIYA